MGTGLDYIIIDAYNVINSWNDLIDIRNEPLEDCREKLLDMLSNYQGYTSVNMIVVFDAHLRNSRKEKVEVFDNLTVVFTKRNQTADSYIERLVYRLSKDYTVGVVTSDYLEQRIVLSGGGVRITPRELRSRMFKANSEVVSRKPRHGIRGNNVLDSAAPELLKLLDEMRKAGQ